MTLPRVCPLSHCVNGVILLSFLLRAPLSSLLRCYLSRLGPYLIFYLVTVQPNLVPSSSFKSESVNPTQVFSEPSDPPTPDVNPFHQHAAAVAVISGPERPPQRSAPPPLTSRPPPTVPPKTITNPFLINKNNSAQNTTRSRDVEPTNKLPPLPPRKPVIPPPPPRHSSQAQQPSPVIPILPTQRPVPTPPTHSNLLIQQSLQATRVAQSLKRAEQRLEKERVLEVLKSSNPKTPNDQRLRSASPTKEKDRPSSASASSASSSVERRPTARPQLPPRRNLSPPASTAGSSRSFEQVAYATVSRSSTMTAIPPHSAPPPPLSHSPNRTPPRPLSELPAEPPPTHPDRKPLVSTFAALDLNRSRGPPSPPTTMPMGQGSPTGTSPRVFRSRSMHYPSPPPLPPSSRKRPESFQLSPTIPSSTSQAGADFASSQFTTARSESPRSARSAPLHNNFPLSRHVSLSLQGRERERERSPPHSSGHTHNVPLSQFHKALSDLQQKAQPRLDAARFKAEAGLTKRGFVRHGSTDRSRRWREDGETRLVSSDDEYSEGEGGADVDLGLDTGEEEQEEQEGRARSFDLKVARFRNGEIASGGGGEGALNGVKRRSAERERDDLKWPAGEGWTPL